MARLLLVLTVILGLSACGVKSELDPPPGAKAQPKGTEEPSQPPKPLGGG
ncbi:MAG: LPS translocon maturation chaperone LptM [Alphaproteobacteria bacterium]